MHQERMYMIMELCTGGELFDRIAECAGLAEEHAKLFFLQIVSALAHCHANGVYHRDLKPENVSLTHGLSVPMSPSPCATRPILPNPLATPFLSLSLPKQVLLDKDGNAKVADFGLAAVYQHVHGDASFLQHTKVGSVMYAAPEVLTSSAVTGYDAAAADMWSLGIILFSMLSGTLPFECAAPSRCKRYAAVVEEGIQIMCPEDLSQPVQELLKRLLNPDPKQRFTPEQALACDWLQLHVHPAAQLCRLLTQEREPPRTWTILVRVPDYEVANLPSVAEGAAQGTALATDATAVPRVQTAAESKDSINSALFSAASEMDQSDSSSVAGDARAHFPGSGGAGGGAPTGIGAMDVTLLSGCGGSSGSSSNRGKRSRSDTGSTQELAAHSKLEPPSAEADAATGVPTTHAMQQQQQGGASAGASASGATPAATGSRVGDAIPLRGCISEFVLQWGWEPLPKGTERLLRDIFETLHSMGLKYTMHEQQTLADQAGGGGARPGAGYRVLVLQITFDADRSEAALQGGRPVNSAGPIAANVT